MKLFKSIFVAWLLFCAVLSIQAANSTEKQIPKTGTVYVVYYLHNTLRCYSCNRIEYLSKKSILGGKIETPGKKDVLVNNSIFQSKIKDNTLFFESLNIDKDQNKHYLKDFSCKPKFTTIAEYKDGKLVRSKTFDKVWMLLKGDPQKFVTYIQQGVADFINN